MTSFHFTSTPPSAQLLSDIQSINGWDVSALESFSSVLVSFLGQQSEQESLLSSFVSSHPALKGRVRPVLTSLLHFFSASIKQGVGAGDVRAHVHSDLRAMGVDEERASLLASHFLSSLSALTESALEKTLSVNQLTDISWKFGVSAASSEMEKMGSTFLQLQMKIQKGGKEETQLMELSLPQFYHFLQQMQLANRQMQNLAK